MIGSDQITSSVDLLRRVQTCEPENECETDCKCVEGEGCVCEQVTCEPFQDGDKCKPLMGDGCRPHEGCWYGKKECKEKPCHKLLGCAPPLCPF